MRSKLLDKNGNGISLMLESEHVTIISGKQFKTRELANVLTHGWLRNTAFIEESHGDNKISQKEMKAAMIEASARLDYVLRKNPPFSKFILLYPEYIIDFAFHPAIKNNLKWEPNKHELESLKNEICINIDIHKHVYSVLGEESWMKALYCLTLGTAGNWDMSVTFNGQKLIKSN